MNICPHWEYLEERVPEFWVNIGMYFCCVCILNTFASTPLCNFHLWTVTMAMRGMERASVSQLSGTIQHLHPRTAALVKATLTARGK